MGIVFIFFNDAATTEIYTLSLHDALPISAARPLAGDPRPRPSRHPDGGEHSDPRRARGGRGRAGPEPGGGQDRKSTRLNSSHANISYAVFCLKKKIISLMSTTSLLTIFMI